MERASSGAFAAEYANSMHRHSLNRERASRDEHATAPKQSVLKKLVNFLKPQAMFPLSIQNNAR